MATLISRFFERFNPGKALTNSNNLFNRTLNNVFNNVFYRFTGDVFTEYDNNSKTYLEQGYNNNSTVYAIIDQMSNKLASIPLYIQREANNAKALQEFQIQLKNLPSQVPVLHKKRLNELRTKAFTTNGGDPSYLPAPLERPNPHQNWQEFFYLTETFLKMTGNIYWYCPTRQTGNQEGEPYAVYVLPSPLIRIVLKQNADLLIDSNPIKEFMLIEGYTYDAFDAKDVIHITYANPNYNENGEHLYGHSPLRSVLLAIQTHNEANKNNAKTMANSGAYGFIHGEQIPLEAGQAQELKTRLKEMDANPGRLERIAGVSQKIGFTRISLSTKDLMPFDYIDNADKEIANALGWSVLLLNDTDGAKYDNLKQVRQRLITDSIIPDCRLIEEGLNTQLLPRFKGYQNTTAYFDASQLPEMQQDIAAMVGWLSTALADGVITRDEYRAAINYMATGDAEHQAYTVNMGVIPLTDALNTPNTEPLL